MTAEEITQCWQDRANWRLWFIYFCRQDPRVIVPKRGFLGKMGWTFNFARPLALPCLVLIIASLLAPILLMLQFGVQEKMWYGAVTAAVIVAVGYFCARLASPQRCAGK